MRYKGNTKISFRLSEGVKIEPKQGTVEIGIKCDGEFEMQSLARQRGTWTPRYHTLAEQVIPFGGMARLSESTGGMFRKLEIRLPAGESETYDFSAAMYSLFDKHRDIFSQPARA